MGTPPMCLPQTVFRTRRVGTNKMHLLQETKSTTCENVRGRARDINTVYA